MKKWNYKWNYEKQFIFFVSGVRMQHCLSPCTNKLTHSISIFVCMTGGNGHEIYYRSRDEHSHTYRQTVARIRIEFTSSFPFSMTMFTRDPRKNHQNHCFTRIHFFYSSGTTFCVSHNHSNVSRLNATQTMDRLIWMHCNILIKWDYTEGLNGAHNHIMCSFCFPVIIVHQSCFSA